MKNVRKRILVLIAALPVVVVVTAVLYMVGMRELEGRPRDFWSSLEWAAETLTSTGYGFDGGWSHPAMVLFVISLQFLGVFLVFTVVSLSLLPYLEARFESRLPRSAPRRIEDHVVLYRYGAPVVTLQEELENAGVANLVLELDEALARHLVDREMKVVYAPNADEALLASRLGQARALIANGSDEENAAVILHARHLDYEGEVIALVSDPHLRQPMALAGADAVYTPRHLLAIGLAARASPALQPRVSNIQHLGRHLEVSEIRIHPKGELAGKTLAQLHLPARVGTTVIGQWVAGHLEASVHASTVLEPRGILVAVGRREGLERLAALAGGAGFESRPGPYVVAGCGVVGGKICQLLRDLGEEVLAVDRQGGPGIDVVGDILDVEVLGALELPEARAAILALDSDAATLFATVVIRDRVPDLPIIARVNEAANVERIHRAGVDFALSVSNVAGQILAQRLLKQEAIAVDMNLRVLKVEADRLVGHRIGELAIRARTSCSVVAVERGDEVIVDLGKDFLFEAGDCVYICGANKATHGFAQEMA